MIQYYAFMGLLCLTLILWAIIAIRDDSPADDDETGERLEEPKEPKAEPKQ